MARPIAPDAFPPIFNLDCPNDRKRFLDRFGTLKGRALANRLGLTGKGSTHLATAVSCYAWNAETASQCRLRGDIQTATQYERICDNLYRYIGPRLSWW